ncbi:hypothetical protein AOLI_G00134100 [Acnodon oligacanthus]
MFYENGWLTAAHGGQETSEYRGDVSQGTCFSAVPGPHYHTQNWRKRSSALQGAVYTLQWGPVISITPLYCSVLERKMEAEREREKWEELDSRMYTLIILRSRLLF